MSAREPVPGRQLLTSLTAALTTWAATWAWRGFTTEDSPWLVPLLVLAVALAVAGALGRRAGLPAPLLVLGQLVLAVVLGTALVTGSAVPGPGAGARLAELLTAALDSARAYAAPVPSGVPSLAPLLVAGGLVCLVVVDALVGTLRRPALAGLPLLAIHALPVSVLGTGASWQAFAVVAAGFLLVLALQEDQQVEHWGRGLAGGTRVLGRPAAARAGAVAVGGAALALALAVPVAVPTAGVTLFEGGLGAGGDGRIELEDPMVDLRRDLRRGADVPLLEVRTDDPDPDYLRLTVLERFSENAWSSGARDLPERQRADGATLPATGVDPTVAGASATFRYAFTATEELASVWLPHPFPVRSVQAAGDWKYDVSTLDFLAADRDGGLDTAGLTWQATGLDPAFDEAALDRAPSSEGYVDGGYTRVPDGLPPVVSRLAREVTAGARSDLERAKALQYFFRVGGGFEYSLEAEEGNGGDALEEFLTEGPGGRIGYCEQFASAMAVMAREVGVPARVALGFLEPEELAPGRFRYSSEDLHAWPELYFAGQGWVRFEPTPGGAGGRAQSPPPWSLGAAPAPAPAPAQGGLGADPLDPDRNGAAGPAPAPEAGEGESAATDDAGAGPSWRVVAGATVAALALLAVALLPRRLRRLRSSRRWGAVAAGGAPPGLTAWRELRDGCADLGVTWPAGLSPESTGTALRPAMAAGPLAAEAALTRVVRLLEREWYAGTPAAASPGEGVPLRADVDLVLEAVGAGASPRARLRAEWLPLSVLRGGGRARRSAQ